jgi:hypothetical protein
LGGCQEVFERVQIIVDCRLRIADLINIARRSFKPAGRQLAIGDTGMLFSRVAKPASQGEIDWQQKI